MKYDIVSIGSATKDAFMISKKFKVISSDKFSTGKGECVALGSKFEVDKLVFTTGGGATNTSATFGSLGFKTACITRVGDDANGKDVIKDLKKHKVDAKFVKAVKGGMTAFSVLLTLPSGERTVLVHRGVSASFDENEIQLSKMNTKWFYITSVAGNLSLIRKTQKSKAKTAWNPGTQELAKGIKALRPIIERTDIFQVNLEEASALTGIAYVKKDKILKFFHPKQGQIIIVTDGIRGAYAITSKECLRAVPNSRVKPISRTGAGDAFGSAFTASIIKNKNITTALQTGVLNAESVVSHIGAKRGIIKTWPNKKALSTIKVHKHLL
ncbi:MAG: ribokinase family sugar kinase [uncultured bacterium]|nr:MAG: ribokinase family sugar kinase [uncultured bacterium]HBD05506.1 hypothetical protein [Candidatus Uhrbacteria bacterium]